MIEKLEENARTVTDLVSFGLDETYTHGADMVVLDSSVQTVPFTLICAYRTLMSAGPID